MPDDSCVFCGNTRASAPSISFHRFPANPENRAVWLRVFQLDESDLKPFSRVCSRHFPDGDAKKEPEVNLGERFASPKKRDHPRAQRANRRDSVKELAELRFKSPSASRSVAPHCWDQHKCYWKWLYTPFFFIFNFLGPVINELHYWGEKGGQGLCRVRMLDPINELFLTLVKLN